MAQLNLHLNPEFEEALARFRRLRGLPSKSAAVRVAVQEALEREQERRPPVDYREWLGLGLVQPTQSNGQLASHDDLWTVEVRLP